MLAYRSSELLFWASWNPLFLWYLLHFERYRTRIGANLATAFGGTRFIILYWLYSLTSRSAACSLVWGWVPKHRHPLFLPPKTSQQIFVGVLSCPGRCGQVTSIVSDFSFSGPDATDCRLRSVSSSDSPPILLCKGWGISLGD